MEWWQITLLIVFGGLLIIGGVFYYAKKQKISISKSSILNFFLHRQLKKIAHDYDYLLLKDMYMQIGENSYIRFDEILIAEKYVYIITQKHWPGVLQANIIDNKWILRQNKETAHVDNPLSGANFRLEALMQLLKAEKFNFVNIISLGKKIQFSEKIITNNNQEIILNANDVVKQIINFEKTCSLNSLTDSEMERIANLINDENVDCRSRNRKLK